MNSDQKIRCDDIRKEILDANLNVNDLKKQIFDADNFLINGQGKLSRLNDELRVKKAALLAAQVGNLIPGPFGRAGGVSIPVLEAEIRQIEQEITNVQAEMQQAEKTKDDAAWAIGNEQGLIAQNEALLRQYGC